MKPDAVPPRRPCRRLIAVALSLAAAAASAQVARTDRNYTPGEWALLPAFCVDSQDGPYGGPEGAEYLNKSPRAREWVGKMGKDFWHMHHYCRALRDTARAEQAGATAKDKAFLYLRAEGDLNYILSNCTPAMPLLPEAYLRMGDLQMRLKRLDAAGDAYEQARKLKPDYWPAYTRWIDVQLDLKLFDAAKRLAEEGLAAAPGQPVLLERLDRINKALGAGKTAPHQPVASAKPAGSSPATGAK